MVWSAISPLAAVPTTSISGRVASMLIKPARTTGWSSTIKTRIAASVRRVIRGRSVRSMPQPMDDRQPRDPCRFGSTDRCSSKLRTRLQGGACTSADRLPAPEQPIESLLRDGRQVCETAPHGIAQNRNAIATLTPEGSKARRGLMASQIGCEARQPLPCEQARRAL